MATNNPILNTLSDLNEQFLEAYKKMVNDQLFLTKEEREHRRIIKELDEIINE